MEMERLQRNADGSILTVPSECNSFSEPSTRASRDGAPEATVLYAGRIGQPQQMLRGVRSKSGGGTNRNHKRRQQNMHRHLET